MKSLQNVDVISVKKGTEANQNEKHKIPKNTKSLKSARKKRTKPALQNVCKMPIKCTTKCP